MTVELPKAEHPGFQQAQYAFAAHIRDPDNNPAPPDVEDRRMAVYRSLFYNNIESFLATNFPVLRQITPEDSWHRLVRDFIATHRSRTPLFPEIPQEFIRYLKDERQGRSDDPPFLLELAHYEWVELALAIAETELDEVVVRDVGGDLLHGGPVLSPLAWNLSYRFPVHRIGPDFIPDETPDHPTFLVVYRDREDKVGFLEVNPVTHRLLELLQENDGATGLVLLKRIAGELHHPSPDVVIEAGSRILDQLRSLDIVLGVR